jgi:large subunit ribosomal protein L18
MSKKKQDKIRLSVFRSNKNIFAQLIDDTKNITLASSSTLKIDKGSNLNAAAIVGADIAEKAMKLKLDSIYFDRNKFQFKGRVKELATAARSKGLKF